MRKKLVAIVMSAGLLLSAGLTSVYGETVESNPTGIINITESDKEEIKASLKKDHGLVWFGDVRDDMTGNWRYSECASTDPAETFALDYYKAYFNNDKEIHAIINFTLKTSMRLNVLYGTLYCTTLEYVDGEEHSAKTLFSGMPLSKNEIDIKTGEITKIPLEDEYDATTTSNEAVESFITTVEPILQNSCGDNYKIDITEDTVSIGMWYDGFANDMVSVLNGDVNSVLDYKNLKDTYKQIAVNMTTSLQSVAPNYHMIFSILNDQNTENAFLIYYDGELYYDFTD